MKASVQKGIFQLQLKFTRAYFPARSTASSNGKLAAATTPYFQGISRTENEILQQAAQPSKSGLGSLCALMRMEELLFKTREA